MDNTFILYNKRTGSWNRTLKYIEKIRKSQDKMLKKVGIKGDELEKWYKINRKSERGI